MSKESLIDYNLTGDNLTIGNFKLIESATKHMQIKTIFRSWSRVPSLSRGSSNDEVFLNVVRTFLYNGYHTGNRQHGKWNLTEHLNLLHVEQKTNTSCPRFTSSEA